MVPITDQIAAVQRELKMRHRVYPGLVQRGTMTQAKADHEIACMQAVLTTLELLHRPAQALLFATEARHAQ